jgi:uncharacterized Ntn-hydrolase superfamily protein
MTWSIIARDETNGRVGIAVATCAFAVGARVPHIRTGVGAVATQATTNQKLGPAGLDLMARGTQAAAALVRLITEDTGRDHRQVHVMDAAGRFAAHTGVGCVPWCGHFVGDGFSVAGNMLAGPDVVARTAEAFAASRGVPLARRLLAALDAGEAAGGDKRGRQSAALLVHDSDEFPIYDLRVDDHCNPLEELRRLFEVARARHVHYRRYMAVGRLGTGQPHGDELERLIAQSVAEGYE